MKTEQSRTGALLSAVAVAVLGGTTIVEAHTSSAGIIHTIAGGYGPARATGQAHRPTMLTLAGNRLLISDTGLNVVRSIDVASGREKAIAGLGGLNVYGYTGDGGPATAAKLFNPTSTAIDRAGNVYIADQACRVRRVDHATGIITTVAGTCQRGTAYSGEGGPATAAVIGVTSIAVDPTGRDLFIADRGFCRLYKVTSGVITTFAGNGQCVSSGDGGPAAQATTQPSVLVADHRGNLFVGDGEGVRWISRATGVITLVGTFTGTENPLALSPDGRQMYFSLLGGAQVFRVELSGIEPPTGGAVTIVAGTGVSGFSGDGRLATRAKLASPEGIAVGGGHLYIADEINFRVRAVDLSTGIITTVAGDGAQNFGGDGGPATSAQMGLTLPAVTTDAHGDIYLADLESSRVRRIDHAGTITTVAGDSPLNAFNGGYSGDGGPAKEAQLNNPGGLAVDSGTLYISEYANCRIRQVRDGIITTAIGDGTCVSSGDGGPASSAQISPDGPLLFDTHHNLYFADACRVRRVDHATGIITTVVGTGTCGVTGDGGPALSAQLSYTFGMAFDSVGNLFLSDDINCVVRKVDVNQTITTVAGVAHSCDMTGDGGPATSAKVVPEGIAVDAHDALYITDPASVRKVSAGIITTVVGTTQPYAVTPQPGGFSGDGGHALSAEVSNPQGLYIFGSTLYISDANNQRIRTVGLG